MIIEKNSSKNIIYQIIYQIFNVLTPLITSPYLSRVLGVENLGIFSSTYSYANCFMLIAKLGVDYYGNRTISICNNSEEVKEKFWSIYSIQTIFGIFSCCIYFISLISFPKERRIVYIMQGLWIIASVIDISWFFLGIRNNKFIITRNVIIKFISIILIISFVRDSNDLIIYILVMTFSSIFPFFLMWKYIIKRIGYYHSEKKVCFKHLKPMVTLFIPILGLSVFQIMDKIMLGLFSDNLNSGCYYNADKLINIPLGIVTSINTVILPMIAKEYQNNKNGVTEILKKTSEITIFLSSAIGFGLAAISFEFVPLFFGNEFLLCVKLILLLTPVVLFKSIEEFMRTQYLIPTGKDKVFISAVFFAAISNIIANYFLIPKYGALGASIGTIISEMQIVVIQQIGVRKEINFFKIFSRHVFYYIDGIIMFVIIRCVAKNTNYNYLVKTIISICLGGIIYISLAMLYCFVNKESLLYSIIQKNRHWISRIIKGEENVYR